MKKTIILSILILISGSCLAQSIDTAALHILQKSYDRLAAMKVIPYRMTKVDTMIRENHFVVNRLTLSGTINKAYWNFRINNLEFLIRGDTLYKKETPDIRRVTFSTDWKRHEVGDYSIHNILGTKRPWIDNYIASIKFVQDTAAGEFYIIDQVYNKTNHNTDEVVGKLKFDRIFINKKTLFAFRRIQYGKFVESGKEAVDIYDFTASLDNSVAPFNPAAFFAAPPVQEANRFTTLKTGTISPPISAINVKTGNAISIAALKGKVVLLDFWYLSCAPCRELMPKIQKLHEKFRKENVVVMGINIRDKAPEAISKFLNAKHILYPQYYKTGQMLAWDYKLQAFPTTLILGKDGRVKLIETGIGDDTEGKLERAIQAELKTRGKLSL